MKNKQLFRVITTALCGVVAFSTLTSLVGCGGGSGKKKDSITIMTDEPSGFFNPFYATSGADMEVVGMTQISMLSTDEKGNPVVGEEYPSAVKDFTYEVQGTGEQAKTVYTFVLKNNLKFSDGHPLTMQDVFFNMYEYLDPVYTGSSTMYSVDIEGLSQYRTQKNYASGGSEAESLMSQTANAYARSRLDELVLVFETYGRVGNSTSQTFSLTKEAMKSAIYGYEVTNYYKMAVATNKQQATADTKFYQDILWKDYELTLETFQEELESDFKAARESFDLETAPYSDWKKELSSDIFKFFLYEGYITPVYKEVQGKKDKSKIVKFEGTDIVKSYKTEAEAIARVFKDKTVTELNQILTYWGTAGTLATKYAAESIDIQLKNSTQGDELAFPNISGIVSLGHLDNGPATVEMNGKTYNVAKWENLDENGKPKNSNENEVLQITVNGTDPKAIYNFGFSVAPSHYYSADSKNPNGRTVDIRNNKFGVEWASSDFQASVIQSKQHVEVPMGAGAFVATDENNVDNPKGLNFWSSNNVYFKANENFQFEVKAKKLRLQYVSASNALDKLANGEIDYITPQFTIENANRLEKLASKGIKQLDSWQLGYGYIGINAGKIENVNIRRAIMASMQTSLALEYYKTGHCKNIDWPMSTVSWAYPAGQSNGYDYLIWDRTDSKANDYASAKAEIQKYMNAAGYPNGYNKTIKFTIAGASITDHPTYNVFKQSAEILNSMGWDVEVKADSQALTKLSTGSLEVWAAAWGSTIDPDMYQVYHKNSTATSVYAWGYREIKGNKTLYSYEYAKITELSEIIDEARSIMYSDKNREQAERAALYKQAMSIVLDIAVEMPVYQRKTLYAYNTKTIKGLTDEINDYTSPLEKIWELELV